MKFSENWLRELVDLPVTTEKLLEQLNLLGLEVDGVEPVAPAFSGVVVAEITGVAPHPEADRLWVCQVNAGQEAPLQIVCGAANATPGLKAPLALAGAQLPNGMKIKKSKLRGIESFGMLCSEAELGLLEKADGLMALPPDAPLGQDIRQYLQLEDRAIEIDLTPNRGDCLSLRGVARELAVANGLTYVPAAVPPARVDIKDTFSVSIEAPEACPRYAGRVIRGIDATVAAPLWMVEKLRRSGLRSISPAVDVTNYVMLEMGQPMHAFDLAGLKSGIRVRLAGKGERLHLLNDSEIEVHPGTLVIADANGSCALAGIMGGEQSAVSADTRDIFLESAFFTPAAITGWPRRYGLHTDSSHRFERGVDPGLQREALERATQLLLDIVGGKAGPVVDRLSAEHHPGKPSVLLRRSRIRRLLGYGFEDKAVETVLEGLGVDREPVSEGWKLFPPSYRFDLNIEVDFIEELARVHGYQNLPRKLPEFAPEQLTGSDTDVSLDAVRAALLERDYHEVVTYSFIDPGLQQLVEPEVTPLALRNPISSELSVMRTSLLPGLLHTLKYNVHRQQKQLNLFETGLSFIQQTTAIQQNRMIAGLRYGSREPEAWNGASNEWADFYDIKGDVERLLALGGNLNYLFKPAMHPSLHPGQAAEVLRDGQSIGYAGAIHPRIVRALDLNGPVLAFELQLAALLVGKVPAFAPISRYPGIRRDIAIVVDRADSWETVKSCIKQAGPAYLAEIRLFDVYAGKGVTSGRKSFAIGLILQEISRTLTDDEIASAIGRILEALRENLGAALRE